MHNSGEGITSLHIPPYQWGSEGCVPRVQAPALKGCPAWCPTCSCSLPYGACSVPCCSCQRARPMMCAVCAAAHVQGFGGCPVPVLGSLHGPLQPCVCDPDPSIKCRCPTSFPCPSALGTTFNDSLYFMIGQASCPSAAFRFSQVHCPSPPHTHTLSLSLPLFLILLCRPNRRMDGKHVALTISATTSRKISAWPPMLARLGRHRWACNAMIASLCKLSTNYALKNVPPGVLPT